MPSQTRSLADIGTDHRQHRIAGCAIQRAHGVEHRINRNRFEVVEERLGVLRFAVNHAERPRRCAHADAADAGAREGGDVAERPSGGK